MTGQRLSIYVPPIGSRAGGRPHAGTRLANGVLAEWTIAAVRKAVDFHLRRFESYTRHVGLPYGTPALTWEFLSHVMSWF